MFKPIQNNSTIGIISPAWIPKDERMQKGFRYLEEKGFKVKKSKNLGKQFGYFAGTDEERLDDLHAMYIDPVIDIILCARGGWGGLRLVDKLNYDLIQKNPKPLVGYSDITTLQLAIYKKTGIPSLSGPMLGVEMGMGIIPFTEKHFWGQIQNSDQEYTLELAESGGSVINKGSSGGVLLGGCLSLVSHLLGTPYSPDYSGTILFLEDVGEKPYKIDRYFAHLKQSGVFAKINGLILGKFVDCTAEEDEISFNIDELINQYFTDYSYPIIKDFPYGHSELKFTMPLGAHTKLDTKSGEIRFENLFGKKSC
jgi:muramoyltetrapeptide carboxypeptidase